MARCHTDLESVVLDGPVVDAVLDSVPDCLVLFVACSVHLACSASAAVHIGMDTSDIDDDRAEVDDHIVDHSTVSAVLPAGIQRMPHAQGVEEDVLFWKIN